MSNFPGRTAHRLPPIVVACLAATWLIWGSTYLAIKFALVSFPPYLQMGSRFLVAGAGLAAWMRWIRKAPWPQARQWYHALIVGGLMLGGGMGSVAIAEQTVGSGLVVVFIAIIPLLIALVNLFWRVIPGRLELVGIGLGLVGVVMLTRGQGFQASPVGLAAVATACTCWSVGSVLSQRLLPLAPGANGVRERDARGRADSADPRRRCTGTGELAAATAGRLGLGVSRRVRLAARLQRLHGAAGAHVGGSGGELLVREPSDCNAARYRLRRRVDQRAGVAGCWRHTFGCDPVGGEAVSRGSAADVT